MLDSNKFQEYFDQYNSYSKTYNLGSKYLELGKKVMQTRYYRLLYYPAMSFPRRRESGKNNNPHEFASEYNNEKRVQPDKLSPDSRLRGNDIKGWGNDVKRYGNDIEDISKVKKPNKTFLIVPSIFNSPEIFFLSRDKNFIDNLRECGEVFLIDWSEVKNPEYLLDDYVRQVIEIIDKLKKRGITSINLIGHCLGGNLAIAANVIAPGSIQTLTLLTTPWDFSHFFYIRQFHRYFDLDYYVDNLPVIPKIHLQILFFLLFPNYFNVKLDKFFSLTSLKEQDLAFRIENWLMSGNSLPKATYYQIMQNILDDNMFANLRWKINNTVIDPGLINQPVYIVTANNDQIVPKSSILSLHRLLKDSTLLEVEGGHISYLVNNKLVKLFHFIGG
ncbi:alpha/beta fold hydrolase [Rickettsia endosymbiont of Orchestes rusci]|uniref:alpha/beta fold hydrolase n=1 Tax=Rickettsia endosymbiont of Orchestes rusci TaxID=3066250 RepID=UPI00313CFEF7